MTPFPITGESVPEDDMREQFLLAMRMHATTVTVVSASASGANAESRRIEAMTATAVCSVSADPPALLVCINQGAAIHDVIAQSGKFCVNLLRSDQQHLSDICARPPEGNCRLESAAEEWAMAENPPRLRHAAASLVCHVEQSSSYASHSVFIGRVTKLQLGAALDPLIYADGSYRQLAAGAVLESAP